MVKSYVRSRRIYRGAVNLILFRHCPSKSFWKCTIWNINIQYKNDWYTLQNLTKPVFAFRHWENLVSSSIYPSWYTDTVLGFFLALNNNSPPRCWVNKQTWFMVKFVEILCIIMLKIVLSEATSTQSRVLQGFFLEMERLSLYRIWMFDRHSSSNDSQPN